MINSLLRKQYAKLFSKYKILRKLNNRVFDYALSAKGYNNWRNSIESGERYFIKKYLANDEIKLCIDIGANKGSYTKMLLEETIANVIAFEPLPFIYSEMESSLSDFKDRCTLINMGVGAKSETLKIHYNEERSEHASFSEDVKNIDYVVNSNSLDIRVISLDEYCELNKVTDVDLVKIDTEGFEKEVFLGAVKTFNEIQPKFIQIEYNWHQMFRQTSLFYFSDKLPNYDVYQLTYDGMSKVDAKHPHSNIYIFSNFVFIRKDISAELNV